MISRNIAQHGGGLGAALLQTGKRAVKRWAWGLLAPLIIPGLTVVLGGVIVLSTIGVITNAGVTPELRMDAGRYQAIAAAANPPEAEPGQRLTWGLLKAAEFVLGSGRSVEELAQRLAPEVRYSTYAVTRKKTAPDGTELQETISFSLVSEVRTYDTVYTYDYTFTEREGEIIPERHETSRMLDRSKLYAALSWYAGEELDPLTVHIVERTASSFDTGAFDWSWLGVTPGAIEGQVTTWPVAGMITSSYGYRIHPVSGAVDFHTGVDIAAETGTPIPAVAPGRVILAGFSGGYGLCVMIEHENGYTSLYGHASRILVAEGDTVKQNQIIAEVGDTGVSTGPHLHFEMRLGDEPVDPTPWLR